MISVLLQQGNVDVVTSCRSFCIIECLVCVHSQIDETLIT